MHIEKHSYEAMMNSYRQNTKQGRGKLYAATILAIVVFFANFISGGSIGSLVHMTGTMLWNTGTSLKEDVTQSGIFTSRAALTWANESDESGSGLTDLPRGYLAAKTASRIMKIVD